MRRYFDALQWSDLGGVRATLARDYHYDGATAETFDPFRSFHFEDAGFQDFLRLTYRSLNHRIEQLTRAGSTLTAVVTTTFQGNLNLQLVGFGKPPANGESRLVIEFEPRGGEWKLTVVRTVRLTYLRPGTRVQALTETTVNRQKTSLEVSAGKPLLLTGKAAFGGQVLGFIGPGFAFTNLESDDLSAAVPWELELDAPMTPGRYVASPPEPDTALP